MRWEPQVGSARNSGVRILTREGADGRLAHLDHEQAPAEQAHSGSFGRGRTAKNKL